MIGRDPFIEDLAAFRGIGYEEAERQHKEDQLVDQTESLLMGHEPTDWLRR